MEKQWYVYILQCADNTLYTGITDNLAQRVAAHNSGKGAKYTRGRGLLKVVYSEACEDKSHALRREIQIKKLTRPQKNELCSCYKTEEEKCDTF